MKTFNFIVLSCILVGCSAESVPDDCSNCQTVADSVRENFHNTSRQHAYHNFQQICVQLTNTASACSKINVTFFDELYGHLEKSFLPTDFCFNAGECSTNAVVTAIQIVRSLPAGEHDSPECELCKQLVKHVVTNLTENDFHEVLVDVCKQIDSFKFDCMHITDDYYSVLHDYLVDKLNAKAVCSFFGMCSGPGLFGAVLPLPAVKPQPTVKPQPVANPLPKPAPVPIPVTPRAPVRTQQTPSTAGCVYGCSSLPSFNFNLNPGNSLAPLATGLAGVAGALAAAAPVLLPVFAVG